MVEYKCPYCGQDSYAKSSKKKGKFTDWKSVRGHINSCKLNDNFYTICEYYGPISLDTINTFSNIKDFRKSYPNLSFKNGFFAFLRKTEKADIKSYVHNKEDTLEKIKEFYNRYGRLPHNREWIDNYPWPAARTVVYHFGSWNAAILAAGFQPNENDGYGTRSKAKDGILYRSQAEVYFVNNFLFEKYTYKVEPRYSNDWMYDFYVNETQEFIEIDGGLRPTRMLEKIEYNKSRNIKFRVITTQELYSKNFKY